MTRETQFPEGDFRRVYFGPENLGATLDRVHALRGEVPAGMSLPDLALRFILADPRVSTVIPGMRSLEHVRTNIAASDGTPLRADVLTRLRAHRWDRTPTAWSL